MEIKRLFEDEALLVLDKPAGVVVNRAETVPGETVQDWFVDNFSELIEAEEDETFNKRLGMVHRLDKETSGCLLWAKQAKALKELMRQFKQREVQKEYIALVHGRLAPQEGTIRLPITRDSQDRHKRAVSYEGKQAETSWQVIKRLKGDQYEYSLVKVEPKTGRTHQIRVHLNHLGHAVVADSKYLKDKRFKRDREKLKRQFLHAYKIGFVHPMNGEVIMVESKLPSELQEFLVQLTVTENLEVEDE